MTDREGPADDERLADHERLADREGPADCEAPGALGHAHQPDHADPMLLPYPLFS